MNNNKTESLDQNKSIRHFLIVLTLLLLARQLWWAIFGALNVDEFENLQIIWLYKHGIMPYLDYYHTHLPVYNVLLYPIYAIVGPTAELPGIVRMVFSPIVFLAIWQVGWIGYKITRARTVGWLTVVLFLSSPLISDFLSHIRPDLFGLPLALFSVMLYLDYTKQPIGKPSKFYLAGFFIGLSLLFSHKPVFLALILLWFFEQYHYRILKLPFIVRLCRFIGFCVLLALPFMLVTAILLATGLLNLDNLLVVTASQTNMATNEFFWWLKLRLLLFIPLFSIAIFALGILGSLLTKFWLGIKPDRSNAGAVLIGACAIVGVLQLIFLSALVPHHFVFPFAFLSIAAAYELKRGSKAVIVLAVALALIPANLLDREHYQRREEQTEEFRFLLNNIPDDVPVLDSRSGLSAFRVIVGRHMYYRPGFFDKEAYREYNKTVAQALKEKMYGAVLIDDLMIRAFPDEIKKLIEKNYYPSPFPNILIPLDNRYMNDT